MINLRLDENMISDLVRLSDQEDFPYHLTKEDAARFCIGTTPTEQSVQTYGAYHDGKDLVSVMTATFCRIFPHKDSPNGKMVHISGAYTHPEYRNQGHALTLLNAIERDAVSFGADYLCCDSTVDTLYQKAGFVSSPQNEERMWKKLA